MKRIMLVFIVFLMCAPVALFYMSKHIETDNENYLYGFFGVGLIYILLSAVILHGSSLLRRFFGLNAIIFVALATAWSAAEIFLFDSTNRNIEIIQIMQISLFVSIAMTMLLWFGFRIGKK